MTSLPSPHGIGDMGAGARLLLDWLERAGMRSWQILPLSPPAHGESPYGSESSLSGNVWLIDLDDLVEHDLLGKRALDGADLAPDRVDFPAMRRFKGPLLSAAAERLVQSRKHPLAAELDAFRERATWVGDAALFDAIKAEQGGEPWWSWPAPLRDREPKALREAEDRLRAAVDRQVALQFLFDRQWTALRAEANARGIEIIGDLPIYVGGDSVDVWANRALFRLDEQGRPTVVAGVPPDYFSETGQKWGNPLYDWPRMAEDGYRWWVARLGRTLEQVDVVRIDHFRGFAGYWEVPAEAPDARTGEWIEGPGTAFFDAMRAALGDALPIIAEDLGVIDDSVIALREAVGAPGMRILQFAFGGGADNRYLPHNHTRDSIAYTGTHDNDTTLGWWLQVGERAQDHVRRYFGVDGHDLVWDLIRAAMASVANRAIVPLQDVLALGSEARMNTPGVAEGNWGWRARESSFDAGAADRLAALAALYDRVQIRPA